MKPLCEVTVKIIPALRAMIVKELIDNYGMTQTEAAKKLGMTQAAISQYLKNIRGKRISFEKEIKKEIEDICKKIHAGVDHEKLMIEFCYLCKSVRERKLMCLPHKALYPKLENCCICF